MGKNPKNPSLLMDGDDDGEEGCELEAAEGWDDLLMDSEEEDDASGSEMDTEN